MRLNQSWAPRYATMFSRFCIIVFCVSCIHLPARGADPEDGSDASRALTVKARLIQLPTGFLDKIGLVDRKNPLHHYYVLTSIEAFFLVAQGVSKNEEGDPRHIRIGQTIRISDETDNTRKGYFIFLRAEIVDGPMPIRLMMRSSEESLFVLSGTVNASLSSGDSVYLPSRKLERNGERQLFLVLTPCGATFKEKAGKEKAGR